MNRTIITGGRRAGKTVLMLQEAERVIINQQRQLAERNARIEQLEKALAQLQLHYHAAAKVAAQDTLERDKEIANLRARLELADALLNKERGKTK